MQVNSASPAAKYLTCLLRKSVLFSMETVRNNPDSAPFGVIFDADGVLIDSEPQSFEALRRAILQASRGGLNITSKHVEAVSGRSDAAVISLFHDDHDLDIEPEAFSEAKHDFYRQVIAETPLEVPPGVREFVQALAARGISYAVATSAARDKLVLSLESVGLLDLFPVITSADDEVPSKPDPAIFLLAAERLAMPHDRIVVFEDTVNGVEAARRAGMFSVGVIGTFPREALVAADRVIDSFLEVDVDTVEEWLKPN